jgi:hypothetical protein
MANSGKIVTSPTESEAEVACSRAEFYVTYIIGEIRDLETASDKILGLW